MSATLETLGRYRLVSLLGEGGMGQVYKAYDTALERHVALKILPAELVTDAARVARFVQEARAASALNHPNVIVVHDIGEERVAGRSDSIRFMAMELIDGMTLRDIIAGGGAAEIRKALGIMLQVAEALTAAHAAGIVHRDLKPENIMVTSSGYAKVLDFGLAKLRAQPERDVAATEPTQIKDTHPGTILGTASYMAPEQALGHPVDHRADIFSFGLILHELVTGRRPFSGHSVVDTLHRIIYSDPEPMAAHRADAPRDLIRIARKALAKNPDDRYQTMKDLAIDLRELIRELDAHPSGAAGTPPALRRRWIPVAAMLAVAAMATGALVLLKKPLAAHSLAGPSSMHVSRVTATGKVITAAISRDGSSVAYVISDPSGQSLWIKRMTSGQSLQLIAPRQVGYWGLAFANDGSVYFAEKSSAAPNGAIVEISPLGGTPRPIVTDGVDTPPAFSPDGTQMVFMRAHWPDTAKSAIFVAGADGSHRRALAAVEAPAVFVPIFFAGASWSPDGKSIAAAVRNGGRSRLVSVDVATGTMTTIADPGWRVVAQSAWLPDGSALVAIATVEQEDRSQVWLVPVPKGRPYRVTNDLFDYRSVSITADGRSLVTVAGDRTSDVWVLAEGEAPRRLDSEKAEGSHGVAALADGRLVLTSLEGGNPDLWIMNGDGSGRALLTHDGQRNRAPVVTPDERYIVYLSNTGQGGELCRIDLDGSNRRVLSKQATLSVTPTVSPDSKWVVFQGIDADSPEHKGMTVLSRVSIDGGRETPLTNFPASAPSFSPDGSEIAFYFADADADDPTIGVIPAGGGKPTRLLHAAPPFANSQIAWTPDGTALVVNTMPSDRANLWRLPLDGSKPSRITSFEENRILSFAPLRGRNGWVVARGDFSRDAVVITGFR